VAADEKALGDLHTKVANVLSDLLDGQELPTGEHDEDGNEVVQVMPPSAAIITSAIQFLKNNNITCAPSQDNAIGELADKMQARREKRALRRAHTSDFEAASADAAFMTGLPN